MTLTRDRARDPLRPVGMCGDPSNVSLLRDQSDSSAIHAVAAEKAGTRRVVTGDGLIHNCVLAVVRPRLRVAMPLNTPRGGAISKPR